MAAGRPPTGDAPQAGERPRRRSTTSARKVPIVFTRAGSIRAGQEGPHVPGGTFDRLARAGRVLAAPFLFRARGISAEEAVVPAEQARRNADHARRAMDAGITGGMLLVGGPAGPGRPRGVTRGCGSRAAGRRAPVPPRHTPCYPAR